MFSVTVLYGQPTDERVFDRHYEQIHARLAQEIPGLRLFEASKMVATPDDSPSPYHQVVTLGFDTFEDAQAGLQSSAGQATVQDLATFATGGSTVLLGPTREWRILKETVKRRAGGAFS